MFPDSEPLCNAIQHNCHIADARHASEYTLCIYLLKMREYFRWERGYTFSASMPKEELGNWLTQREHFWETLEQEEYTPINIDGRLLDPFDTETINAALLPKGYIYSGGIGHKEMPHFFLGRLDKKLEYEGYTVLISADECARDLTAPPAMALGTTIFIRRESLQRMIWEKVQEWQWHRADNAMKRALSFYDFDEHLDEALDQITTVETEAVILHEIGEVMAGEYLGDAWEKMLLSLPHSRGGIMARAVRDHLADALSTLPKLIETENTASLHFYCANMAAMRKELYPSFLNAYEEWLNTDHLKSLTELVIKSRSHWLSLAHNLLELHEQHGEHCLPRFEKLVETHKL